MGGHTANGADARMRVAARGIVPSTQPAEIEMRYVPSPNGGVLDVRTGHEYPQNYTPERVAHLWNVAKAWDILDIVKCGVIPPDVRSLLAGQIAGALSKAFEDGRSSSG